MKNWLWAVSIAWFLAGCGGEGSTPTTPPSPKATTTVNVEEATITFSGTVTNIVTSAKVVGAVVTIGATSATSGTDGTYTLTVPASEQTNFSAAASGYYTRESTVSMSGATTINLEIIPQGDGFDLTFFDYLFRDNGTRGTERYVNPPTYEIWTRQFTCLELSSDGWNACVRMQALEAEVPAQFEALVRGALAKIGQLTGGAVTDVTITTKSHTPGTILQRNDWGTAPGVVSIEYQTEGLWVDVYGTSSGLDQSIHEHEVGHSLGFSHPSGQPTLATFMKDWPYEISPGDELHGLIMHSRPKGSLSPDRDPEGVTIN